MTEQVKVEQSDRDAAALKPCPFCGGAATFEHLENGRWTIGCKDLDGTAVCMGFQSLTTFATKREAIIAWNTRPAEQQIVADMAAIPREPTEAMVEAIALKLAKAHDDLHKDEPLQHGAVIAYRAGVGMTINYWNRLARAALRQAKKSIAAALTPPENKED